MTTSPPSLAPSALTSRPVYLCQPAIDRPGWLDLAVGLQLQWAEVWGRAGVATCCQLLVGHDQVAARPVPLFRYLEAPRREEIAEVRREQPQAGLLVQARIWSASACGDEPWGEVRLVQLGAYPAELCHIIGGGSVARWRRWASAVETEVGRLLGRQVSRDDGAGTMASIVTPAMSETRLSKAGRSALLAHGLGADPVWVGLLDDPSPALSEARRPWSADLNVGVETLYRGPRPVAQAGTGFDAHCATDNVCHAVST